MYVGELVHVLFVLKISVITVPPGTLGTAQSSKMQLIQLDYSTFNTAQGTCEWCRVN